MTFIVSSEKNHQFGEPLFWLTLYIGVFYHLYYIVSSVHNKIFVFSYKVVINWWSICLQYYVYRPSCRQWPLNPWELPANWSKEIHNMYLFLNKYIHVIYINVYLFISLTLNIYLFHSSLFKQIHIIYML